MTLLYAFIIMVCFLKAGVFADITPDFQLLCVCVLIAGGLAGMGGGKHE